MKCPKCSYISFDYNQVCPKCNRDISELQAMLFLPSFRPEPPSLLGILTGEANESHVDLQMDTTGIVDGGDQDMEMGIEDTASIEDGTLEFDDEELSISFDESQEIQVPDAFGDDEAVVDFDMEREEEDVTLDQDEVSGLSDEEIVSLDGLSDEDDGLSLDEIDDSEMPDLDIDGETVAVQGLSGGDEGLDLGEISLDDSGESELSIADETFKIDDSEETSDGGDLEEMELDDTETELDLGDTLSFDDQIEEKDLNLDDLPADDSEIPDFDLDDETLAEGDDEDLDIGPVSFDAETESTEGEVELDLGDLKINETGELEIGKDISPPAKEDDALQLGDLALDEQEAGDEFDIEDLEIDVDALTADQDKGDITIDEEELDLDNLDLDLDLDGPKK